MRRIDQPWPEGGELDEAALRSLYAYPESLTRPWFRVNFVASLDGAMTDAATVGALATPADKAVFHLLRHLADAIVVGAGTVRAENYGGAAASEPVRRWRVEHGLAPIPPVVIVSASGRIEPSARVVADARVKPLLITSGAADPDRLAALAAAGVEVVRCAGSAVSGHALGAALAERGLLRVLCEGGPTLLGQLLDDDLVDELCLTTAPVAMGGRAGRIATSARASRRPMRPGHVLADDDGTLLVRWVRR